MNRPTLALCIPAYNAASFLPRLLRSAKDQSIPFDEILVYNDCSTDNTAEVARNMGARVIEGNVNQGCSFGKNQLAIATHCDWIHFHDADDDLLPNFTEVAHKWMKKENAPDILLLHYEYRDFQTDELLGEPHYNQEDLISDPVLCAIRDKMVNFALIKKGPFLKIGGFDLDPMVLYNEDRAFYIRAAINGLQFDYEPTLTCINFRYHKSMSVSNQQKCFQAILEVFKKASIVVDKKYFEEIAKQLWANATVSASVLDWKTVDSSLKLAFQLNGKKFQDGSRLFSLLCVIDPFIAFRMREYAIRLLKPSIRQ